jgi:hypothetical protein
MRLSKSFFARHWFRNSKTSQASIELIEGNGVRDDAHFGITVMRRLRTLRGLGYALGIMSGARTRGRKTI